MNLTVHKLPKEEVYKDFFRIPEAYRKDAQGGRICEGTVCRVSADGRTTLAYLRGLVGETGAIIRLDEKSRNDLGVTDGNDYDFTLHQVGCVGQFKWALCASDPTPRIAAKLGVLSLVLGGLSAILAIWSVYLAF